MVTLSQVIQRVDDIKPNAFSNEAKTAWLNECEGLVQTEVFLWANEEVIVYDYEKDKDRELLVAPPHDKLYWTYLAAMIDFANGEYNKYQNTMQMFNAFFGEFMRWFAAYRPADTHGPVYGNHGEGMIGQLWRGYYITAYGIAVKHGFAGTEAEWLESLTGAQGESVELRYEQESQTLQWKYTGGESWQELLNVEDLQGAVVAETLKSVQEAEKAAQVAQKAAEDAAENGENAKEAAETAATSAAGAQANASKAAQEAATRANQAQQSASAADSSRVAAEAAAGNAKGSETNAHGSAAAAKVSETNAKGSETVAQKAATDAQNAETGAENARAAIENMLVEANTLASGQDATVSKSMEGQVVKLTFGLPAGPAGPDGSTISATGLWGVEVDENGDLILTYTGDDAPPLSINEDGDLVYTLDGSEVNLGHVVGRDSQTPSITIGQVETLPAGSPVTASITGQTPNLVLNLGIPQGKQGDPGQPGEGVPPADDVPTDYLLSVGGWVPPPSGGSPGAGDMELVASATLEEAVDVISLELSKPCTEVIAVLTPYGDDSNQDTNTIPYMYAGDGASVELKGLTLGTMKLKSNSAMVYAFRAARFLISGNLVEKTMYEETGAAPTGITPPDSQPWNFKSRNWEIVSINALQNIRLQLWGYVWGVGTKLEIYGR